MVNTQSQVEPLPVTQPSVPVLEVHDLAVQFPSKAAPSPMPLQGVQLRLAQGDRMALVGESGSGKSLTAAAILGMLPSDAEVVRGSILLGGEELIGASERRLRQLRGRRVAIMFQNPAASLNPVRTVGTQIAELIRIHEQVGRRESRERAIDLLDQMGIPEARRRSKEYVHQYSGGMAQRAALAMALSCRPDLLIADEPTTGLDATLQQQVLELVVEQVAARSGSLLLITHDIGIVGRTCKWIAVMYAGRVMESGRTDDVLGEPRNPYTAELVKAYSAVGHSRIERDPRIGADAPRSPRFVPLRGALHAAGPECHVGVPELRPLGERMVVCVKA